MSSKIKEVDFYFDLVCPFAYLCSTQIDDVAGRYNVKVNWHPVLLGGVYVSSKAPQGKKSATTNYSPDKRVWSGLDLKWRCSRYNVTLKFPSGWPSRTVEPMRLLLSIKDMNLRRKCAKLLYHHYFVKNDNLVDRNVLSSIVKTIGIQDISAIDSVEIKELLKKNTDDAVARGIFGVPTYFAADEQYFGVDRLSLFDVQLKEGSLRYPPVDVLYKQPCLLRNSNVIEFYFDFVSPWSFLGYNRLAELAPYASNIIFRPIFLGGISPAPPIFGMQPVKRQYYNKDIIRYFKTCNVLFKFNSNFPVKTLLALRVFLLDNNTIDCLFRAVWQQNLNIGDKNVLRQILDRNGFNGKKLIELASTKNIKNRLKNNTAFAKSKGIFGVPTYVVNNDYKRFVWGQDRMDYVKDLCNGWKPLELPSKKNNDSKL